MSSAAKILHRLVDACGFLLGLSPLVVAASALLQINHRVPELLLQFTAPLLVATALATALAAILRLKATMVAGLISTVLLAFAVAPQWFPESPKPAENSPELRVYWSNVWARNHDLEAISASVKAASPDIVLMAEVSPAVNDNLDTILPEHLYRVVSVVGNRNVAPARVLIASRWPIRPHDENTQDRLTAISALAQTPLGEVGLMSAHLTRPWPYRTHGAQMTQARDMARLRPLLGQRAIIAGDFNSVSNSYLGRYVAKDMGVRPAPAFPGTWPSNVPSPLGITIDQVWHSPELAVKSRELGKANGSDHRPVIVRFTAAR